MALDEAPGQDIEAWRASGNLRGQPPVRQGESIPNIGIVEDEGHFNNLLDAARDCWRNQLARTEAMKDGDAVKDNRYWFSWVYQAVTQGEIEEAESSTFFYPTYVMRSVLYFDRLYEDNVKAADEGGTVEDHWREAFRVCAQGDRTRASSEAALEEGEALSENIPGLGDLGMAAAAVTAASANFFQAIRALVASMQAHIRYDLPRAEAWVFEQYYQGMEGAQLTDFHPDFAAMDNVFEKATGKMNGHLAEMTGVPADMVPRMLTDFGMDHVFEANMSTERSDTWRRAEGLVDEDLAGTSPYTDISGEGEITGDVTGGDHLSGLSKLSDPNLRPSMEDPAAQRTDNEVRADVAGTTEGDLAKRPPAERVMMLRRLISGATLNDDEATILTILSASVKAGDLVTVVNGANAWDLCYVTDGDEFDRLRETLRKHYYPNTTFTSAVALIRRCINGETAEWEEEMIADLLCDRSDGKAILTQLGREYADGGYEEGLDKVLWQVDFKEQSRIEAVYGE